MEMVGDQLSFLGGVGVGFFLISLYIGHAWAGGLGLLVVILALLEFALGGIANGTPILHQRDYVRVWG